MNEMRRRQRDWAKRQRTYECWVRSLRSGRDRTKLPIAQQFQALVRRVQSVDKWGIPDTHLIPIRPQQRIRMHGRRVAMQTAAWMIAHGPIDRRYTAVSACGVPNCCEITHLNLTWRKYGNGEQE